MVPCYHSVNFYHQTSSTWNSPGYRNKHMLKLHQIKINICTEKQESLYKDVSDYISNHSLHYKQTQQQQQQQQSNNRQQPQIRTFKMDLTNFSLLFIALVALSIQGRSRFFIIIIMFSTDRRLLNNIFHTFLISP